MTKNSCVLFLIVAFFGNAYSQTAEQHLNSGTFKFKQKDFLGALAEFNNAINKDASLSKAYNNRGIVRGIYGYDSSAIADFNKTISLDTSSASAYLNRGLIYLKRSKYEEAVVDFQKAHHLSPEDNKITAKLEQASFLLKYSTQHNIHSKQAEPEIKDKPNVTMSNVYVRKNSDSTSLKELPNKNVTAIKLKENTRSGRFFSLDEHVEKGNHLAAKLDFEGAYKAFSTAIQQDSTNSAAYYYRGVLKLNFRDYKEIAFESSSQPKKLTAEDIKIRQELMRSEIGAIEDFSKAIQLDTAYSKAYYMRAMSFYYLQEYRIAILDFNRAILYNQNYADAYYYRGLTKGLLNEVSSACLDFLKAADLGNVEAKNFIGSCR